MPEAVPIPAGGPATVVAIPAKNEAARIGACLAALAIQRDGCGTPLPAGSFGIVVLANNCTDATAGEVERWAALCPHPTAVLEASLPPERANAGWARRTAMDAAAGRIRAGGHADGLLLTTDADSCVSPTWIADNRAAIARGADAVAGYVDGQAAEIVSLGPAFLLRGRLEDRYLRLIAEIHALCDPRAHDPWPNHRVSSGASLAVTLRAYEAIGGLPTVPVGEDAALTAALEEHGFRVRHAMDVTVSTSCRFDGRAPGGAADTMRDRHGNVDAPCDADMEAPRAVLRRAAAKGRLRRRHGAGEGRGDATGETADGALVRRLGLAGNDAVTLLSLLATASFEMGWRLLSDRSPRLARGAPLTPADLPGAIRQAERVLRLLRASRPARWEPAIPMPPRPLAPPQAESRTLS